MDLKIKTQTIYNLYTNGEIIEASLDTDKKRIVWGKKGRQQSAGVSKAGNLFVTKICICGCGKLTINKYLRGNQKIIRCPACAKIKRTRISKKWYQENKNLPKKDNPFRNEAQRDTERDDCIYSMDCLEEYQGYDCRPCKGCKSYVVL